MQVRAGGGASEDRPPLKGVGYICARPVNRPNSGTIMSHRAFSKIYYHFTWHVKDNQPLLTHHAMKSFCAIVHAKSKFPPGILILEIGGTENHVHLAIKAPPTLFILNWVGENKGASSHLIIRLANCGVSWQEGYGVVSFKENDVGMVVDYIKNQTAHHASQRLFRDLEETDES